MTITEEIFPFHLVGKCLRSVKIHGLALMDHKFYEKSIVKVRDYIIQMRVRQICTS